MRLLKQSTARNVAIFMTSSTDHVSGATGLTLTITAAKDGAAFASITPTVTELANGWYSLALTTSHTGTLGDLALHITSSGADPTDVACAVVLDLPGASVSSVTGNVGGNVVGSVASVTATVAANLTQILGTALTETSGQIAAAFKQFFNIASPTSTINTITAVTTTGTATTIGSTGLTAIAAAVWNALTSGLTTAGSIGALIVADMNTALSSIYSRLGAPAGASIAADIAAVEANVAEIPITDNTSRIIAIKASTDNLPSDPADESNIISATSAILTAVGLIPTNPLLSSSYTAPNNSAIAAIKLQTDQLGFTAGNVNANAQVVSDKSGYVLANGQLTIKKDVALNNFEFFMSDSTNHDPATGLTVSVFRSIDGGAFVATTNSATEISGGVYKINLSAADLNGGVVMLNFSAPGADPRYVTIVTQA